MDQPEAVLMIDRMLYAGVGENRSQEWLRSGAVVFGGDRVTDPDAPAAPLARIVLLPADPVRPQLQGQQVTLTTDPTQAPRPLSGVFGSHLYDRPVQRAEVIAGAEQDARVARRGLGAAMRGSGGSLTRGPRVGQAQGTRERLRG